MLKEGTFKVLHKVDLSEEDRNARGRQAARQASAIKGYKAETERLTEEWATTKKTRKTTEETMTADLFKTSAEAETGKGERWIDCEEVLMGGVVVTRAVETGETIDTRNATMDELRGTEKKPKPGAKLEPPKPEEKAAKLDRLLLDRCAKQFAESAVIKAVIKDAPEATAVEVKARITILVEAGKLVENDGKLLAVHPKPAADDGIVDNDYRPDGPTH